MASNSDASNSYTSFHVTTNSTDSNIDQQGEIIAMHVDSEVTSQNHTPEAVRTQNEVPTIEEMRAMGWSAERQLEVLMRANQANARNIPAAGTPHSSGRYLTDEGSIPQTGTPGTLALGSGPSPAQGAASPHFQFI